MSEENKPRTPLKPLSEAERVALAHDRGRDFDNLPLELKLTDKERAAAVPIPPRPNELAASSTESHPPCDHLPLPANGTCIWCGLKTDGTFAGAPRARKPLLPEKWAKWAGLAGFMLGLAIFVPAIPTAVGIGLGIAGGLLALLSGGALPQFKFLAGRPLLTGPALAVVTTVEGILGYLVHVMPVGLPMQFCMLGSTICCFLIGKAAPQFTVAAPTPPPEPEPRPEHPPA